MRRAAAGLYDCLLLLALMIIATLPLIVLRAGESIPASNPAYQIVLLLLSLVFFAGFWAHGGQTLGMRAWRLRLTTPSGGPVRLRAAVLRYFATLLSLAALGVGFLWMLVDRDGLSWHDRWSGTRIIVLPKPMRGRR